MSHSHQHVDDDDALIARAVRRYAKQAEREGYIPMIISRHLSEITARRVYLRNHADTTLAVFDRTRSGLRYVDPEQNRRAYRRAS
jgi:hypothetical protein